MSEHDQLTQPSSHLAEVLDQRGLDYECSDSGEWVRFTCPQGLSRYIIRSRLADGYQAWCAQGKSMKVEWYPTAEEAVDEAIAPTSH